MSFLEFIMTLIPAGLVLMSTLFDKKHTAAQIADVNQHLFYAVKHILAHVDAQDKSIMHLRSQVKELQGDV